MADEKLKPSEHATRVLGAASQGARGTLGVGLLGLGTMALGPLARKMTSDTTHVPVKLRTDTVEQLGDLTEKILRAGGRDPDVGRPVQVGLNPKPGHASLVQELWVPKGRKAKDIIRLGLNATPESIAHEVGHLTSGSNAGRLLSRVAPLLQTAPALAIPGLLAATALLGDPDKDTPLVAKAAPYVGAAQLAAILGDEIKATHRGSKLLRRIGYKSPLKQRLGRYSLALLTLPYAATLIGAPLGVLQGIKAVDKARKLKRPVLPLGLFGNTPQQFADTPTAKELKEKWAPLFK